MSKERELLLLITKRFQEEFNNPEWYSEVDKELQAEIKKLLAQPEPEISYMKKAVNAIHSKSFESAGIDVLEIGDAMAILSDFIKNTSQPKQEPLSDEAIDLYCKNKDIKALERLRFYHGVLFAEKAHGIGVDNE